MKTLISLGLVLLSLVLIVAPRRGGTNPPLEIANEPFSESGGFSRAADAHKDWSQSCGRPSLPTSGHDIVLKTFTDETDPDRRSEAIERLVQSGSTVELPALLDFLIEDASPEAHELSQLLVRRWAEGDASAAAVWASRSPESPSYRDAVKQVAIAWAQTNLPAAADWVRAMPEGERKQAATLDLAYEAARSEPMAAFDLASPLPPSPERDALLVHAISQWAGTDFNAAEEWAMKVTDLDLQQRLVAAVAVAVADKEGATAAALVADALEAGILQDRTVVAIVQRWAQISPAEAASWVSQFPDIPARAAAVNNLLAFWTVQDSEAAENWLRELPAGSLREAARAAYAQASSVSGEL